MLEFAQIFTKTPKTGGQILRTANAMIGDNRNARDCAILSNCCGVSLWSTLATLPTRPARHNLTRWRCSCLFVCGSGRCRRCCGVGKMRLLWVFAADWLGLVTSSPVWLGSYPRVEDRYGSPEGNRRGSGLFGEGFAWTIRTMTSRSLWPVVILNRHDCSYRRSRI